MQVSPKVLGGAVGVALAFAALPASAAAANLTASDNNPQVSFDDLSVTPGFAFHDWTLDANEDADGGLNRFALLNDTVPAASRIPFQIIAGAPNDSFFMDSEGDLGLGEDVPVLDLHLETTNTPAVRFEQTNGGGFTPQTWDIGANEANFFVRDVTNGSRLSFRIRPGAPTSSIDISGDGDVGLGTGSPDAPLDVEDDDGVGRQNTLRLTGNDSSLISFADLSPSATERWQAGLAEDGRFTIGTGGAAGTKLALGPLGDLALEGAIGQLGTAGSRTTTAPASPAQLMTALRGLDLTTYQYAADPTGATHIGPTAEEFQAELGFGTAQYLPLADLAGVALAASQNLDSRLSGVEAALAADTGTDLTALTARVVKAEKKAKKALKKIKKLKQQLND